MNVMMMLRRLWRDPDPGEAGAGAPEVSQPRVKRSGEATEDEGGPGSPRPRHLLSGELRPRDRWQDQRRDLM